MPPQPNISGARARCGTWSLGRGIAGWLALGSALCGAAELPAANSVAIQQLGFEQLLFVKRHTYNSNHYYTEYVNSAWTPGGNLCLLNLKDATVRELVAELKDGIFERFDLSFDAKRVVFAWKKGPQDGYRIYEINLDGSGLRQLTFPQPDDADLVKTYRKGGHYHHGTDDMHPCYLPDGGIAFISTRCQYGILCDDLDDFTTTVIFRIDADGKNLRKLSNSTLSEAAPVVLPDGRIMYTRWEYVDKGAVSVKGLWAMRPDGSGSAEIFGNDIALPPTLIYGRPIPDVQNHYVVLGAPHYPQNGLGTVIRLDMNRDIRSRDPMTYITPGVDIRGEGGFSFRQPDGSWVNDGTGQGPLFKDPYPLSDNLFLVAHKPAGTPWHATNGYGVYLLDAAGQVTPVYRDPAISCWLPYPVRPRQIPPVTAMAANPALAANNEALCMVSDVYHGLENVRRGEAAYLRILEQIPRPWTARRRWDGDHFDQQHACITKNTHLGLKVQHGIVPVEIDGSACFVVPAGANLILQVLDKNYLSLQTERTYVHYMPGEVRGCVGCHEVPQNTSAIEMSGLRLAMRRPPSVPGPQPGEKDGRRTLDYAADVQPVWDRHCLKCHGMEKPKGNLNLSATPTTLFNVSYESLLPDTHRVLGPVIGENHPKTGNVVYLPAKSLGSHASVLVAMLAPGLVELADPAQAQRAAKLAEAHQQLGLSLEERVKVTTWVDTNFQYYGSYWGRRNLKYAALPDFRPHPTFDQTRSRIDPNDRR